LRCHRPRVYPETNGRAFSFARQGRSVLTIHLCVYVVFLVCVRRSPRIFGFPAPAVQVSATGTTVSSACQQHWSGLHVDSDIYLYCSCSRVIVVASESITLLPAPGSHQHTSTRLHTELSHASLWSAATAAYLSAGWTHTGTHSQPQAQIIAIGVMVFSLILAFAMRWLRDSYPVRAPSQSLYHLRVQFLRRSPSSRHLDCHAPRLRICF
jgi:hypothetical protein